MATSELLLQLVYFMEVTVHYELNSMSIVTLIACHLTYFYSREILDYTFITAFSYSEYCSLIWLVITASFTAIEKTYSL